MEAFDPAREADAYVAVIGRLGEASDAEVDAHVRARLLLRDEPEVGWQIVLHLAERAVTEWDVDWTGVALTELVQHHHARVVPWLEETARQNSAVRAVLPYVHPIGAARRAMVDLRRRIGVRELDVGS